MQKLHKLKYGQILSDAGKMSHEVAEALALQEYEKYRVEQNKDYVSDFNREVKGIIED